ncbi:hypothetical protein JOE21_000914 [Desmospora profundinema]|uniref:Uncharacterized protein n=1 Tax=Desmospora profundinema TaxID=1571184 RepID=A0ABU1IJJ0_9BACL|nr:hypothetical protein [Desmospora profundinema]
MTLDSPLHSQRPGSLSFSGFAVHVCNETEDRHTNTGSSAPSTNIDRVYVEGGLVFRRSRLCHAWSEDGKPSRPTCPRKGHEKQIEVT